MRFSHREETSEEVKHRPAMKTTDVKCSDKSECGISYQCRGVYSPTHIAPCQSATCAPRTECAGASSGRGTCETGNGKDERKNPRRENAMTDFKSSDERIE